MTIPSDFLSPFPEEFDPPAPESQGVGHEMRTAAVNLLATAESLAMAARCFRDSARSLENAAEMNKTSFDGRQQLPNIKQI